MPAQIAIDALIFVGSTVAAFILRCDGIPEGAAARQMLSWLPVLVFVRLLVNWRLRVYRMMWRFFCLSDGMVISRSLVAVSMGLVALRAFAPANAADVFWLRLPFNVIAVEFLLSLCGSVGARTARRLLHERRLKVRLGPGQKCKRVLLYGAGRAGVLLSRALASLSDVEIVGFIDDDTKKSGDILSGVRVLGTGEALDAIIRNTRTDEVIVSIAAASSAALTSILARCRRIAIPAKIIPGVRELLSKDAHITSVRDIRIDDLLGRDAVTLDDFDVSVRNTYRGKRILVTGAGGSIGSELTRQLLLLQPRKILILDKDENSIYELEQELRFRDPRVPIEAAIADIKLPERVFAVFAEFRPEVVFHAAAHKHVPLMEMHPCEAVLNNVMGTDNVLRACRLVGTERFVFISTDKAVNPTNIMGATKRLGEKLVRRYAGAESMKAACVRFGNVMGSRGSVVPLFLNQIRQGGPVTVTHPDIVRYFMTIPEAVHLVLSAGSLAAAGEVFVLDMGAARKIIDLARQVIVLCGLDPGRDIQIAITGLRPGEKMNEELVGENESASPTRMPRISVINGAPFNQQLCAETVVRLIKAARRNDQEALYGMLAGLDLGYTPGFRPARATAASSAGSAVAWGLRTKAATA